MLFSRNSKASIWLLTWLWLVCTTTTVSGVSFLSGTGGSITELIHRVNANVLKSVVVVDTNGEVDATKITTTTTTTEPDDEVALAQVCSYEPNNVIVVSHPSSIDATDKFYDYGGLMVQAIKMTIDYINLVRCGVRYNGTNYMIELRTYGDRSDPNITEAIGTYIASPFSSTDFMLAGYSSGLTAVLTPIAQANNRLIISGGASSEAAFANKSLAFGILPSSTNTLDQAVKIVSLRGATTIAALYEEGLHTCSPVPDLAERYNMEFVAMNSVPTAPNSSSLVDAAYNMSTINPDVVITCLYGIGCAEWIRSMRKVGWTPAAQIFSVCMGSPEFEDNIPVSDIAYMMGGASWNKVIEPEYPDAITSWTPAEFATQFEHYTYKSPAYQHTAAAASLSVLVQAIELANSLDPKDVARELASNTFYSMYGETYFDVNGQNEAPSFLLQYDQHGQLKVVSIGDTSATSSNTSSSSSSNSSNNNNSTSNDTNTSSSLFQSVYPMPSWNQRDCMVSGKCAESGGICENQDGTCNCKNATRTTDVSDNYAAAASMVSPSRTTLVSIGVGSTAVCKSISEEDMNYISTTWIIIGIVCVAIQACLSISFFTWSYWYRKNVIVKASQPFFLYVIAFGSLVLSSSIVPTMFQGGYRYMQDPITGQIMTDVPNPDIGSLDAACMAFPWLSGIGFVSVFSALFAKIWRVKKLLENANRFRRKTVAVRDVLMIMVVMLSFEVLVLLLWQLISPLRWQREVLQADADGYPLESVGSCKSDHSIGFVATLGVFNGGSLLYSLYLCWITRNVPSDFSEGTFVTVSVASTFQILILGIPVIIITSDNASASFFVVTAIVFLCSSTVSVLIFVPKIWKVREGKNTGSNLSASIMVRKSTFSQQLSQHLPSASQFGLDSSNPEPSDGAFKCKEEIATRVRHNSYVEDSINKLPTSLSNKNVSNKSMNGGVKAWMDIMVDNSSTTACHEQDFQIIFGKETLKSLDSTESIKEQHVNHRHNDNTLFGERPQSENEGPLRSANKLDSIVSSIDDIMTKSQHSVTEDQK